MRRTANCRVANIDTSHNLRINGVSLSPERKDKPLKPTSTRQWAWRADGRHGAKMQSGHARRGVRYTGHGPPTTCESSGREVSNRDLSRISDYSRSDYLHLLGSQSAGGRSSHALHLRSEVVRSSSMTPGSSMTSRWSRGARWSWSSRSSTSPAAGCSPTPWE